VSVDVVAANSGSMLKISGRDAAASFYVDDVRVEAVPEPTSLTVVGIGAVLSLLKRRRTK
jgi:hypothetical protein